MTNNWYLDRGASRSYRVRNKNYQISRNDAGLSLYLKVDGSSTTNEMPSTGNLIVEDITVSVSSEIIENIDYINIIHSVENKGNQPHDISIGIYSDIDINGSDYCYQHNLEGHKGVEFQANPIVKFILKHSPKVIDVDTYSYTGCPGWGRWSNCSDWSDKNADAFIYFSWQNRRILPNEIQNYSYSIGTGEYIFSHQIKCETTVKSHYNVSSDISLSISVSSTKVGELFNISRKIIYLSNDNEIINSTEIITNKTDTGTQFIYTDNFIVPSKEGRYEIIYTVSDIHGSSKTNVPIFINRIPTLEVISTINQFYLANTEFILKLKLNDDTYSFLSVCKNLQRVKSERYVLNNVEQEVTYSYIIPESEEGTTQNISFFAVDEYGEISDIFNYTYTVTSPFPRIKLSDVIHPISIESRDMKIHADYYLWEGSHNATFISRINDNGNISLLTIDNVSIARWSQVFLEVSVSRFRQNTNNEISFFVIDSLSRISNIIKYSFIYGQCKCADTRFYELSGFTTIALIATI
ncbi:hypothetical protein TVAG_281140 [Trichomonas vaginalis G3]|uniref:Uncharacterized protein n=1 Tax=Trichomonas vaginalis (strain ATCC PRA-98 / G3) TaxID=412133 RepID=A2DRN4_TRIV3|nr:serine-type endopeptidase protein [Trichomonas vaginalis G3]EAY16997.1 hypothetical protein TVAG_281140 [Trichomonas vaginalis G3]KAI5508950.1 serine-type endopeptidase protein [Trichomonas vaginalis G3]|eukprot:XP_001329220.1 hypothetical protein [Trichomonas vaginalis G3]